MSRNKGLDEPEIVDNLLFTSNFHNKPYPFISPTKPENSAAGKNVIVTGGGTGIGKAIAISFAQAGAKSVSILGRRESKLQDVVRAISKAGGTKVTSRVADLTDMAQTVQAVSSISSEVGPIDIFVSNAASLGPIRTVTHYDANDILDVIRSNVISTLHAAQAFLSVAAMQSPVFINISAALAHERPLPMFGVGGYSMSKLAGLKLLDYFGAENPLVRIIHVQPGIVQTEMSQSDIDRDDRESVINLVQYVMY